MFFWTLLKKANCFPYGGLFNDHFYHFDTYAVSDIEVYYISTRAFEKICLENLQQMFFLLRKLSQTLEEQERRLRYCLNPSAVERIIQSLMYYKQILGKEDGACNTIAIKKIAASSGTTRETVGQVMKQLKMKKKITYIRKMITFYGTPNIG